MNTELPPFKKGEHNSESASTVDRAITPLMSYLEADSVASTVWKVRRRGLKVCAFDRAVSYLLFELGIGPICSWHASESENKSRHFWPWHNPFKKHPNLELIHSFIPLLHCVIHWAAASSAHLLRSADLTTIRWPFIDPLTPPPTACWLFRVDGGVSRNDFLQQCIADVIQRRIHRTTVSDMTSRGAAFLAGLAAGVWSSQEELLKLADEDKVFIPQDNWAGYRTTVAEWERAVRRAKDWYSK